MISTDQAQQILSGGNVVDSQGTKIGKAGQVFLDDQTGQPEWVTVKTGLFGGAESFVPLAEATMDGQDVRVPFDKDTIKDAPRVDDSEGHLDEAEEEELFAYYGLGGTAAVPGRADTSGRDDARSTSQPDGAGHDVSGPDTDSAMTRSEEQLHVGTERVATGKARLRKFVVTENVTQTVPVSHEEVRIEREPITEANRGEATSGGELTSEDHEVELTAERVVVDKETVPVERVRMETDTVTGEQRVDEEVRKEEIAAETDGVPGTRGTTTDTTTDSTDPDTTTPGSADQR